MKKKSAPLLYISLAFGILFVLMGLVLLLIFSADSEQVVFSRSSVLFLLSGAFFLFMSLAITRRAFYLSLGLNLCFVGISSLIFSFNLFGLTLKQFWPVYMIFFGISLIPSGYYGFRRLRTVYLFPSVLLIILGGIFCLFSFDIISLSFSKFFSRWWPVFLILVGVVLITVFLYQRQNKTSFPYLSDDDYYDDDDEETGDED